MPELKQTMKQRGISRRNWLGSHFGQLVLLTCIGAFVLINSFIFTHNSSSTVLKLDRLGSLSVDEMPPTEQQDLQHQKSKNHGGETKKVNVDVQSSFESIRTRPSSKRTHTIHIVQIWSGSDDSIPSWLPRLIKLNQAYADKHGYKYELLRGFNTTDTHVAKIGIFLERLKRANDSDVFLYMDTDAVVWNSTIKVESFDYKHYDMVIPGHYYGISETGMTITPKTPTGQNAGINSGVWIVSGTEWSKRLFEKWYSMRNSNCCTIGGDQVLLHHIISKNLIPDFHDHVKFVRASRLNIDDAETRMKKSPKPSAEFIVHLWGGLKGKIPEVLSDVEANRKPRVLAE